ncbi:MAG: cyclic pyranopterin monophosphate synthase MoaC [Salinibacter sp.]
MSDPPNTTPFAHLDADGDAHMVDVSGKPDTVRTAVAEGHVAVRPAAFADLREQGRGADALRAAAQAAGREGIRKTSHLVPLCHDISLERMGVDVSLDPDRSRVLVRATARTVGPTGVEMEALTGASMAALAVCDALAPEATRIENVCLLSKTGGQSGDYHRSASDRLPSSAAAAPGATDAPEDVPAPEGDSSDASAAGPEESHEQHREAARSETVRCALVTVSDTRTPAEDESGALMQDRLEAAGHEVVRREIVPDEQRRIASLLDDLTQAPKVDAILLSGGTGISARDGTYEVVDDFIERDLPGFGELFRVLSYDEVGAAAMLSRATAGVCRNRLVFSMPGSTNAVELAMDELIVPELQHLVWEVRRQDTDQRSGEEPPSPSDPEAPR